MSFSLAPAGSPTVPRVAATWLRTTAIPAVDTALRDVSLARERAAEDFVGVSGVAYAAHTAELLGHLQTLWSRLSGVASLVESYADRLVAHAALLAGVRDRALAAGLEVRGDLVLPPHGVLDSVSWSDLAGEVLGEHQSLAAWVATELDSVVASYADPDLGRWVLDFLDANRVGLALSGLETTAEQGGASMAARGLLRGAQRFEHLGKVPGPVSTVVDTVSALEGETPAQGVAGVVGGVAAASVTAAAIAALPVAVPVVVVGVAGVAAAAGGTWLATKAWQQLPEGFQDTADEVVAEAWDEVKDDVTDDLSEAWDCVEDTAGDLADGLADSLVGWAR